MSSKKIKLLIGAAISAALIALVWFLNTPKNFEDCVLKYLKGSESSSAAVAINNACAKKFPTVKKDTLSVPAGLVDFSVKLQPETSFYNVSLGDSKDTVLYKLGPAKQSFELDWEYDTPPVTIVFKDERVIEISQRCNYFAKYDIQLTLTKPALNGVSCGASENDLNKRYKNDAKIYCYKDKERRLFLVTKLNLFFGLHRGSVEIIGIESRTFNLAEHEGDLSECVN
jgi:hypothetical protein